MQSETQNKVQGAQVVGRVAELLRIVGRAPDRGAVLSEIVTASGLTRPTVYRLLNSLAIEGLLDHDKATNTWHLGPEMYVMGAVAANRYAIEDIARPSLRRLAEETGESAFLSIRRGAETVCLMRVEGSFPVRSFVLHEGVRFPLGVASAGLAILAFLPALEIERLLDGEESRARAFGSGHTSRAILENLHSIRETGYSVNPGLILEGSWGMGAAVFDPRGDPAWALSLTGIEQRFRPERQQQLGRLLLEEAHRITRELGAGPRRHALEK
ncbi:IclR family transcriptional regulator [Paeniglutamicibacter cryotolerans]|uniref:DNA-binding IclR family transcriptional regulator n=1 Tax=Paeniglutamicibacter cryotolerans TaxID=670079 RepID=A0A839QH20_9MICC|nr:IclR family transcriptional regulator [Paeniglutamicibacter cryotolerans]MBB2995027.1 DNA-binding IclR family transcriptional regulator [Paeniglutamicibacter cryotolerans]